MATQSPIPQAAERTLSWHDINVLVEELGPKLPRKNPKRRTLAFGIPRGGIHVAQALEAHRYIRLVNDPREAEVFIDDVIDSGSTAARWSKEYGKPVMALITKKPSDSFIIFPWEAYEAPAEENVRRILQAVSEDPTREGLLDTPRRYVKMLKEFLTPEAFNFTTFENEGHDEMVVVSHIPFFSLCEHHMVPFFGEATVAYLPVKKIVGLSKIPRVVEKYARRLQNQERMTTQIADELMQELEPKGVGVTVKARHLCMEMRGVKKHDVQTTTSALRGSFLKEQETRHEFLNLSRR